MNMVTGSCACHANVGQMEKAAQKIRFLNWFV